MQPQVRNRLGQVVREAWTDWAREQPRHAGEQFPTWDEMDEADREGDRRIAEAVVRNMTAWFLPVFRMVLGEEEVADFLRELLQPPTGIVARPLVACSICEQAVAPEQLNYFFSCRRAWKRRTILEAAGRARSSM